jgi:anion-transporting  ArsA/GET3 family ATPase
MTGLIEDSAPSAFAIRLLDEKDGWDSYLEDNNSYWLLHWNLNTNPGFMHSGIILFSHLKKPEFSKRDVADSALRSLDLYDKKSPAQSTLNKDIDCYLRLYAGIRRQNTKQKEELIGSPLQELNLIQMINDSDLYCFNIGTKPNLSAEVIGYALWDYMRNLNKIAITINEALYREYSPGQVFMLDENSLVDAVDQLSDDPKWSTHFGFSETAGVALIHCTLTDGCELLDSYYKQSEEA